MPTMRRTIARAAKPAESCWPIALCRACCAKTGRGRSRNWSPSLESDALLAVDPVRQVLPGAFVTDFKLVNGMDLPQRNAHRVAGTCFGRLSSYAGKIVS